MSPTAFDIALIALLVIVLLLKEGLRLVGPRLPRPMDRAINLSVALLFVAFCILLPFRLMTDV
jgi:hypothetical protein